MRKFIKKEIEANKPTTKQGKKCSDYSASDQDVSENDGTFLLDSAASPSFFKKVSQDANRKSSNVTLYTGNVIAGATEKGQVSLIMAASRTV